MFIIKNFKTINRLAYDNESTKILKCDERVIITPDTDPVS